MAQDKVNKAGTYFIIPPTTKLWGGYTGIGLSVCRRNGFRALDHYPYYLESPYHTYGLPIGGRCTLLILRSKGQRSSELDIKVEIRFPGFRPLSLPPRVTISHIWSTHERKMFPINLTREDPG